MQRAKHTRLPALLLLGTLLLRATTAAAAGPGATLRQYLDARWRGDVAAAEKFWDAEDLRRSLALGTSYTGLEARFDDNLLWSAAERAAAAQAGRPALRDSSLEAAQARYTVLLPSGAARADTVQYWLRKSGEDWRVTSPFASLTSAWTVRDGRFFRIHASKLRDLNKDALQTLDSGILAILDTLGAPDLARVRLERIKIEYYLCNTDAELRQLGGRPGGGAYRLAGERVVSRQAVDLAATSRALVHLALKETPPCAAPVLGDGLAAALGGAGSETGGVTLRRGVALAAKKGSDLEAVLDGRAFRQMKPATAAPLAAVWSATLLRELGPARFTALYRTLSGSATQADAMEAATVRREIETAAAKRGPALVDWVRTRSAAIPSQLTGGCVRVPEESRTHQPIFRWRDPGEKWSLVVMEEGDEYVFVLGPYQGATPPWTQQLMDSMAVTRGEKPEVHQPRPRPAGDPPQLAILVRERMMEPEAYESALFHEQFAKRSYAGELFGFFITPDAVRLYDYRRDQLVAYHGADVALPGAPPYYDAAAGRACFRLRRDALPKPLVEYMAVTLLYTGE